MNQMINNLQSILTQDHAATSHPIFCVYSKQEVVVDPDYSYDRCFYVKQTSDDYPQISTEEYDELTAAYNKATDYRTLDFDSKGEQVDYQVPEDPCSGGDFDPDDWTLVYVKLVDKFEQAFFIRQNAENFIKSNSHNLGEGAYICVESAYRNPEWQQIRELLISAAKKNENSFEKSIWDEKCYAPVDYNGKMSPVEFMNKILPLTIKGQID